MDEQIVVLGNEKTEPFAQHDRQGPETYHFWGSVALFAPHKGELEAFAKRVQEQIRDNYVLETEGYRPADVVQFPDRVDDEVPF